RYQGARVSMPARQIDGDDAPERVSVNHDGRRRDAPLGHEIRPGPLRVLVRELLAWRSTRALPIAAIVVDEDVEARLLKAHDLLRIGPDVVRVAMRVEQSRRLRLLRRHPPARHLAAAYRQRDLLEFHTQVARRGTHDRARLKDERRLPIPERTHDEE